MINRANRTEIITKDDIKNTEATLSDLLNVSSDVCGDDEIAVLDLPVRSEKRIAGIGIRYIKELLSIKLGRLLAIGGMGLGSLNDIAGAIAKRISEASRDEGDGCEGMLDTYFALNTEAECNEPSRPVCIEELGLSMRSYNCLKRSGITAVSDLEKLSRDELLSIKNLGASSADEILNVLKDLEPREKREKRLKAEMEERERQEECSALASELFAAYGGVPADWSSMIRECIKNEPNTGIGGAVIRLYERTELFDHLRNLLLNLVEAHQDKLVADIMKSYCPPTAKPGMAKMDYYTVGGRFGGFTGVVKGTDCYPNPSGQFDYTFTDEYDAYFYFGQQHGPYKFDNTEYVPVIGAKKKDIAFDSVNKLAVAIQLRVWEILLKEDLRKQYLNGSIPEGCSVRADGVYANGELLLKKNETYAEAAKRHGVKFATFLTDPDAYIDLNGKWHSDDEVFADKAFMKKAEKSSGNLIAEAAEEFKNRLIKYIENTLGDEDYIVMVDTHN